LLTFSNFSLDWPNENDLLSFVPGKLYFWGLGATVFLIKSPNLFP
jgi:hypothetical protein